MSPTLPDAAYEPRQTVAYDRYAKLNSAERIRVYAEMTPSKRMELAIERANRWLDKYKNSLEKSDIAGLTAAIAQLLAEHFADNDPGSLLIPEKIRTARYLLRAIDLNGDYLAAAEIKQSDSSAVFEAASMPTDPVEAEHRIERNRAWNRRLPGEGMPLMERRGIKYSDRPLSQPFDSFESSPYILIGTIEEQQPHLSEDMTAIYTEFKIRVEEVFKSSAVQAVAPGELLSFEREGGKLRLSTGRTVESEVHGIGTSPHTGARYLLAFGRWREALSTAEGYEIRDGLVFPLDPHKPQTPETDTAFWLAFREALEKLR